MSMPVASPFLALVASACLFSISYASVAEGDTLIALLGQWGNVSFPSWVGGQDPCESTTWENVTCDGNGHVIALNVSNRGIVGTLPDAIGDLAYLQVLDVSNAGDEELNSLPQNSFSGGIPESLSKLTALRSLNLSSIAWNSSFPNQIVKLANLEEFEISEASITGNVPDDFFSLTKLRVLYLGGNTLNVTLADFNKLIQLEELSLFEIRFNATIASDMAEALPKLTFLNVHGCSLYGGLPETLGTLRSLQSLELYKNDLSGVLPAAWGNLQNLTQLRLNENYLSGPFPMWLLTDMPRLSKLYLDDNFFWNDTPSQAVISKTALLRIECNYLNGTDPQAGNYSKENPYRTRYNCFNGASVSDLNKVLSEECSTHRSGKMLCDEFYRRVVDAAQPECPPCPDFQSVSPENPASNPCICRYTGDRSSGHPSGNGLPVGAVIGGVLGLVSVFAVILGYVVWKRRAQFAFLDKFRRSTNGLGDWEAPPGVQRFTLEELSRITNNFSDSHVLGAGGFGKVFYGSLDDGRMVAIKRASPDRLHGLGEFRNEVMLLSRLHHRHLVKLEGFCEEGGLEILVYEYMTEGNLHAHLLGKSTSTLVQEAGNCCGYCPRPGVLALFCGPACDTQGCEA